jgi:hypothetical protein
MKTIKIVEVKNYRGGPLLVPQFDDMGEVVTEQLTGPDGKPLLDTAGQPVTQQVLKQGTIVDLLDVGMRDFPRSKWTMTHIAQATKLLAVLSACREGDWLEFHIEDETYKWLVSILKDNEIGVPMFALNLVSVLTAIGSDVEN